MPLKGLITRLGQTSTSSPPLGSLLLPPGGCRHGGNSVLEGTGGLACVPESRLPEIGPICPQLPDEAPQPHQWPLPLRFCPSPELLSHLIYSSATHQEPRNRRAPRTGIWVSALSLALSSPVCHYVRHTSALGRSPLFGLAFVLILAPQRTHSCLCAPANLWIPTYRSPPWPLVPAAARPGEHIWKPLGLAWRAQCTPQHRCSEVSWKEQRATKRDRMRMPSPTLQQLQLPAPLIRHPRAPSPHPQHGCLWA